jgi:hypothetical protein
MSAGPTRRIAATAILMAIFGLFLSTASWSVAPARADTTCTASPVTDPMAVTMAQTGTLGAWSQVTAHFSGTISDGHCAGDSFTFTIPDVLTAVDGSYPITDGAGNVVTTMAISGQKVTVTLNDFVQTHKNVTIDGWMNLQLNDGIISSGTQAIVWTINSKTSSTPLTITPCANCSVAPSTMGAWSNKVGTASLRTTIRLPQTTKTQTVTWSETLTSPGQSFTCPMTFRGQYYTTANQWGTPTDLVTKNAAVTITSCTSTTVAGTVTVPAFTAVQYVVVFANADFAHDSEFKGTASITIGGTTHTVNHAVNVLAAGGSAAGVEAIATESPASPVEPSGVNADTNTSSSSSGRSAVFLGVLGAVVLGTTIALATRAGRKSARRRPRG